MKRSLTEIAGMALKAARGAGVPLGHAEDFATAVRNLAATSPAELDCVALALAPPHNVATLENDNAIRNARVAVAGPCAIDLLQCGTPEITLYDVDAPMLLRSMVAVANQERDVAIAVRQDGANACLTTATKVEELQSSVAPVDIDDKIWASWDSYAANTYVPATEASRLGGAGAGLTDND